MQTFVLTAQLGSLAAVAKKLAVSSAAVSKQLTKLEEELGLQLLLRSTRKIELTAIGIDYCMQCERILEEVEVASALISQVKAVPNGPLKVVSGRHFAVKYIVPHMPEFLSTFPEIELNLELAERIPDLQSEGIDVLIGISISATGAAIQRKIAETKYVYCASQSYLQQFGVPMLPEDMKKHRYITHSMRKPDNELAFNKHTVHVTPYIKVNDTQTMLAFALAGLGIVKLHDYVVDEHIANGSLIPLLTDYADAEVPIFVAYPQRRFIPGKIRCFIDFILQKISTQIEQI